MINIITTKTSTIYTTADGCQHSKLEDAENRVLYLTLLDSGLTKDEALLVIDRGVTLKNKPVVRAERQTIPDEHCWIEWTGGECPVDAGTMIEYIMRDYPAYVSSHKAGDLRWERADGGGDIIRYRIVKNH